MNNVNYVQDMEAGISKGSVDSMGRAKLVGDRGGPNEKAKVNYKYDVFFLFDFRSNTIYRPK